MLQAEQALAGLDCGVEISGRQRESGYAARSVVQAECVDCIGFLDRDYSTAQPLVAVVVAGRGDLAHYAVTVDHSGPHLIGRFTGDAYGTDQLRFQFAVAEQVLASRVSFATSVSVGQCARTAHV